MSPYTLEAGVIRRPEEAQCSEKVVCPFHIVEGGHQWCLSLYTPKKPSHRTIRGHGDMYAASLFLLMEAVWVSLEECMSESVRSHPEVQVAVRSKDEMYTESDTNGSWKHSPERERKNGTHNTVASGKLQICAHKTAIHFTGTKVQISGEAEVCEHKREL